MDFPLFKSFLGAHSVIHYLLCHQVQGVNLFLILEVQSGMNRKVYGLLKEHALKQRLAKQVEKLQLGAHELQYPLVGDTGRIQNQRASHPNKWDKTGTVMQVGDNDQYIVKVDGSHRLAL